MTDRTGPAKDRKIPITVKDNGNKITIEVKRKQAVNPKKGTDNKYDTVTWSLETGGNNELETGTFKIIKKNPATFPYQDIEPAGFADKVTAKNFVNNPTPGAYAYAIEIEGKWPGGADFKAMIDPDIVIDPTIPFIGTTATLGEVIEGLNDLATRLAELHPVDPGAQAQAMADEEDD